MQLRSALTGLLLSGTLLTGCVVPKERLRIALPAFQLHSGIDTADGVDRREAGFIAGLFMARYVGACGMPDKPVLERFMGDEGLGWIFRDLRREIPNLASNWRSVV